MDTFTQKYRHMYMQVNLIQILETVAARFKSAIDNLGGRAGLVQTLLHVLKALTASSSKIGSALCTHGSTYNNNIVYSDISDLATRLVVKFTISIIMTLFIKASLILSRCEWNLLHMISFK